MIYLDQNSTTPIDPRVTAKMVECYERGYLNPASQHALGQQARNRLESAREHLIEMLGGCIAGMEADRLVFTSGGSEANNLALIGLAGKSPGTIIISSIEHPSVVGAADELARRGFETPRIRCHSSGVIDLDHLRELISKHDDIRLISIMLANNETGVIQPIQEAAALCHQANVPLHTDAVQAVGKSEVCFRDLGVTALTFTAHKLNGPRGIGGLLLQRDAALEPIMFGGFQQLALRPGTEDVALAVGCETALSLWQEEAEARAARLVEMRNLLEKRLVESVPISSIIGADSKRLPHTSNIAFPGVDRQGLLIALDMAGVACSTGSACASGSSEPSPVLEAMNLPPEIIESALRFSLGITNTVEEVAKAVNIISRCVKQD